MRLSRTTKSFFMTLVVWLTVFWFVGWSAFSGTDTVWSCPSGLLIDIGSRENPPPRCPPRSADASEAPYWRGCPTPVDRGNQDRRS